jgi:opacity protein-like surface antigen
MFLFNRILVVVLCLFIFSPVYSSSSSSNGFYLGISAGANFANIGQDQSIVDYDALQNAWKYHYTKDNGDETIFIFGANAGYEFALNPNFLVDLGIAGYLPSKAYTSKGKLFLTLGDDTYHLLNYSYRTNNVQAFVEGKLKWKIQKFIPYVSTGVGYAWNNSYKYLIEQVDPDVEVAPFSSNHKTNFAYEFGAGIDYQVSEQNYVGLSYRYAHLGDMELGSQNNQDAPDDHLAVGKIASHDVMLNFTHRF